VIEEPHVVVGLLERLDLLLDEGVELGEVGADLCGDLEVHGRSPFVRRPTVVQPLGL